MNTHLILRQKALNNFGNKEEFNKAIKVIEETHDILNLKPIDFYTKLYNLSLNQTK